VAATLRQVAGRAGVDASTVSRVLRADPALAVRPETRERILTAARELNYRPNAAALSLKLRQTHTLGMLVPDITNPIFPGIFRGVEATAAAAGYRVILVNTDEARDRESLFVDLLTEKRVDGLILATALTDDKTVAALREGGYPFVLVNRRMPGLNERYVSADDEAGARLATEHLIRLGHRRIAHISGPLFTDTGLRRLKAYRECLHNHGIPFESAYVVEGDFREPTGQAAMQHLLELPQPPTAVFCANDLTAIGAMSALRQRGLRLPEDLSLVGFNDLPWTEHLQPPLTTVHVPLPEMGALACTMLLQLLAGVPLQPVAIVVPVRLMERGSTAPPRREGDGR